MSNDKNIMKRGAVLKMLKKNVPLVSFVMLVDLSSSSSVKVLVEEKDNCDFSILLRCIKEPKYGVAMLKAGIPLRVGFPKQENPRVLRGSEQHVLLYQAKGENMKYYPLRIEQNMDWPRIKRWCETEIKEAGEDGKCEVCCENDVALRSQACQQCFKALCSNCRSGVAGKCPFCRAADGFPEGFFE